MKNNTIILIALVLMISVLAACSPSAPAIDAQPTSESAQAPAEKTASAPTEQPTQKPVEPTAAQNPAPSVPFPVGRFVSMNDKAIGVKYNADGTFEWYFGGTNPAFVGNYKIDGDRITIENPSETDPKCIGPATYQWFFDGQKLTFAPTGEDTCRGRSEANADTYLLDTVSISELKIEAADFSYTAPESIDAGWVKVVLTNSGAEPHHVQFLRLNDGVSLSQFEEAMKQGEGSALALVKQVGGVGAIAPGGSASAILNLPAGEYVLICFVPSPGDHIAHLAKGMVKSLSVQSSGVASDSKPEADLTVRMRDFAFDMPENLPVGPYTILVVNDGPEPHELNILRLADGKTAEDVLQFMSSPNGPPPFTPVGGMNGLDPGLSGIAEINLEPGTYAAICNIPSPKSEGRPHFDLGMIKQFTVGSSQADQFPTGKFNSLKDNARGYQFNPDGTFAYYFGGVDPVVVGNYIVVGDLISVNSPTETDPVCQGSVTYKWSFNNNQLTFAPLGDDVCRARRDSFGDTFTKSS